MKYEQNVNKNTGFDGVTASPGMSLCKALVLVLVPEQLAFAPCLF